jgi:DNA-directed RNA polymerase subunit M/transcription elongation factor TFIIS
MVVVYGLLLQAKGDVRRIKLKDSTDSAPLTQESLQSILKKKTTVQELGKYTSSTYTLTLFGYKSGKAGTENKHILLPPLDTEQYYSDILLIASKGKQSWTTPVTFSPDEYEAFKADDKDDEDDDADDEEDEGSDSDESEDDDVKSISSKKKAAEEDGVPEDEEGEESEGSIVEDEDEEGEEDLGEDAGEVCEDEEDAPVVKKASAKKKSTKVNLTVAQNTGRAKQQMMLLRQDLVELDAESQKDIPSGESIETKLRSHALAQMKTILGKTFKKDDYVRLEKTILLSAVIDATSKNVIKHFDNKLFQICYMSAARKIISNLDTKCYVQNDYLVKKLKKGDLQIEHMATMTHIDYAPNAFVEFRERQQLREQAQLEGNKAMATDMFKCGRCNKRETTFYELQTRSADEPMTKFISCVNCGNRWRQ